MPREHLRGGKPNRERERESEREHEREHACETSVIYESNLQI